MGEDGIIKRKGEKPHMLRRGAMRACVLWAGYGCGIRFQPLLAHPFLLPSAPSLVRLGPSSVVLRFFWLFIVPHLG